MLSEAMLWSCLWESTFAHTHTHTHTHAHTYAHTHTHMHACTHRDMHKHMHARTHAYTYVHTRTHTHMHNESRTTLLSDEAHARCLPGHTPSLARTIRPTDEQTPPSTVTPHRHRHSHLALSDPERRAFVVSHFTGEETEAVPKKPAPNHC